MSNFIDNTLGIDPGSDIGGILNDFTTGITRNTTDKWIKPEDKDKLEQVATAIGMNMLVPGASELLGVGTKVAGAGLGAAGQYFSGGDPIQGAVMGYLTAPTSNASQAAADKMMNLDTATNAAGKTWADYGVTSAGKTAGDILTSGNILKEVLPGIISNPSSPITGMASSLAKQLVGSGASTGIGALDTLIGYARTNDAAMNALTGWLENRQYDLPGESGAVWGAISGAVGADNSIVNAFMKSQQYGVDPAQALVGQVLGVDLTPELAAGLKNDNWLPIVTSGQGSEIVNKVLGGLGLSGATGAAGTAGAAGAAGGLQQVIQALGGDKATGGIQNVIDAITGGGTGGTGGTGGGIDTGNLATLALLYPLLEKALGGSESPTAPATGTAATGNSFEDIYGRLMSAQDLKQQQATKTGMDALTASMYRQGAGDSGYRVEQEKDLLAKLGAEYSAAANANALGVGSLVNQNSLGQQGLDLQKYDIETQKAIADAQAKGGFIGSLLTMLFPPPAGQTTINVGGATGGTTTTTGGTTATGTGGGGTTEAIIKAVTDYVNGQSGTPPTTNMPPTPMGPNPEQPVYNPDAYPQPTSTSTPQAGRTAAATTNPMDELSQLVGAYGTATGGINRGGQGGTAATTAPDPYAGVDQSLWTATPAAAIPAATGGGYLDKKMGGAFTNMVNEANQANAANAPVEWTYTGPGATGTPITLPAGYNPWDAVTQLKAQNAAGTQTAAQPATTAPAATALPVMGATTAPTPATVPKTWGGTPQPTYTPTPAPVMTGSNPFSHAGSNQAMGQSMAAQTGGVGLMNAISPSIISNTAPTQSTVAPLPVAAPPPVQYAAQQKYPWKPGGRSLARGY